MSTDAQILTVAREYAAACAALTAARAKKVETGRADDAAGKACDEAQKRKNEWESRLLQLSAVKPAEPAPKPPPEVPKLELTDSGMIASAPMPPTLAVPVVKPSRRGKVGA